MAKQRYVNTHFWDDTFIIDLDPIEKLLFLYLLTNPCTDIAGAYEINLRRIALDTGIDKDMVLKILERFEAANKITFKNGWILIHNFINNQSANPSIHAGMVRSLNDCPDWIRDRLAQAGDRLPEAVLLNLIKPNLTQPNGGASLETNPHLEKIFDGLRSRFGLNTLPNEPEWMRAAIFAGSNNFSPTDFLECFDILKSQEWRTGRLSPQTVMNNLPELEKLRSSVPSTAPKIKRKTAAEYQAEVMASMEADRAGN